VCGIAASQRRPHRTTPPPHQTASLSIARPSGALIAPGVLLLTTLGSPPAQAPASKCGISIATDSFEPDSDYAGVRKKTAQLTVRTRIIESANTHGSRPVITTSHCSKSMLKKTKARARALYLPAQPRGFLFTASSLRATACTPLAVWSSTQELARPAVPATCRPAVSCVHHRPPAGADNPMVEA